MYVFVALELLSIPLYVLCGSSLRRERSLESGLKYLIVGSFGSGILLFGCALVYLEFRFPELNWRARRPAAENWFADFGARDSMIATRPYDRLAAAEHTKIKA